MPYPRWLFYYSFLLNVCDFHFLWWEEVKLLPLRSYTATKMLFMYSQKRNIFSSSRIGRPNVGKYQFLNFSETHAWVEIGTEAARNLFWEYLFLFGIVSLPCTVLSFLIYKCFMFHFQLLALVLFFDSTKHGFWRIFGSASKGKNCTGSIVSTPAQIIHRCRKNSGLQSWQKFSKAFRNIREGQRLVYRRTTWPLTPLF